MAQPKGAAKPPGSGRTKGTLNKVTVDLKAAFQAKGPELIKALFALTDSPDDRTKLAAIKECFDRGWGRAPQPLTGPDGKGPIQIQPVLNVRLDSRD